jgi:o-succinylbenzoate---CoA ligase
MKDWLSESAGLFKSKDYIIKGNETFSFVDINDKASSLSYYLQSNYKIKKGDITAVISDNNINFILLIFALWKLGAVPVPLNIRLNDSEINNLIEFLKPSFIYIDSEIKKRINQTDILISIVDVPPANAGISKSEISDFDEDIALILFTSGTSGNPKGVELTFHNLKASYDNCNTILNQSSEDKWIASLPFYHIGGFSIIIRALLSGSTFIIPGSSSTDDLAYEINKHNPTLLSLVSTQLRRLLDLNVNPGSKLKYVLLGGGYIESSLVDQAISKGWPIAKVYGSTETSSLVTFIDCVKEKNKIPSGGKPLANNQILIVNGKKEILPRGIKGEITVRGESCAKGYYNNPEETNARYNNGIYYTGDWGSLDNEGYLFIDSRKQDIIISGGENINPLDIESELFRFPGVHNAVVFAQEDKEWGHIVSAAIVTKPGFSISEEELKEYLSNKISSFKIPRKFYFLDKIPLSSLGKVQKEKLIDLINNS